MNMRVAIGVTLMIFCVAGMSVAQEAHEMHPIMDYGVDVGKSAQYVSAAAQAMAMSDEELQSFVPEYGYMAYCECPNCYGGVEGNNIFEWSIERPEELKCKFCGTVVLPNEKYPEDKILSGQNPLGETVEWKYYENPETGVRHFLTGNLQRYRRKWLEDQLQRLAKAYVATADEKYAEKVVLVMDRMAEVYPHYPVMQNLPRRVNFRESQEPPYAWDSGRWGYFYDEMPISVIAAYDMVHDSPAFDKLSQERGYDVRERLENDFLRKTYEATAAKDSHIVNTLAYLGTAARLGRVLHDPSIVHWAFGWMAQNINAGFFADGMWHEAPSYHYMTVGGLRSAFASVEGYSDPAGYVDAVDGTRFDNLDPNEEIPFWEHAQHGPEVVGFPDGSSSPIHDTWANEKRAQPRHETVSTICPEYGHASLGRGLGANQMQAQLHFSGAHGHGHYDNLNLTLWAKEREMYSDIGYTWTQMRGWCTSTAGHNLVSVNRQNQAYRDSDGDLLSYFPDSEGVAVVEADGLRACNNVEGMETYRRLLVQVPVGLSDAYVVDVFRVKGGTMHDWLLHGDANLDMTATCSLPLQGSRKWMLEESEKWEEPQMENAQYPAYGMLRDMANGTTGDGFEVDMAYVDEPDRGVRLHMLGGVESDVWLGHSPSVRRAGVGSNGDMRKVYDFWMPQLIVRRQGAAGLSSVFAAVHEPYRGEHFVDGVERLELEPADENAVALRVTHGNTVDTIISTMDSAPYVERATATDVVMRGRLGIVREVDGEVVGVWLFGGESLKAGRVGIESSMAEYAGSLTGISRVVDGAENDAFVTDAELPEGDILHGAWMIVTHGNGMKHGYEIDRVERRDGQTVVMLTRDPGLRMDGEKTSEVYFPLREFEGVNSFAVPLAATMVRSE